MTPTVLILGGTGEARELAALLVAGVAAAAGEPGGGAGGDGVPEGAGVSGVAGGPRISGVSDVTGVPEVAGVPGAAGVPLVAGVPGVAGVSDVALVPLGAGVPLVAGVPAAEAAEAVRVISSLAGRVARPRLPVGEVRIGGFGGPGRLADWLRAERVACVVDATHPFAERISASAAEACAAASVPLLRLQRPGWVARRGDRWHWAGSLEEAAALLPALGSRVFLTTGRQGLGAFSGVADAHFLIRCVDPPDPADLPADHELLLDRGPYTEAGELALIDAHRLDVLVTKDSGGPLTAAKLDAARTRGLPVIVVRRPSRPDLPEVASAADAADWARAQLS